MHMGDHLVSMISCSSFLQVIELQLLTASLSSSGGLVEKMEELPCSDHGVLQPKPSGGWRGWLLGQANVAVSSYRCLAAIGFASLLKPELIQRRKEVM